MRNSQSFINIRKVHSVELSRLFSSGCVTQVHVVGVLHDLTQISRHFSRHSNDWKYRSRKKIENTQKTLSASFMLFAYNICFSYIFYETILWKWMKSMQTLWKEILKILWMSKIWWLYGKCLKNEKIVMNENQTFLSEFVAQIFRTQTFFFRMVMET